MRIFIFLAMFCGTVFAAPIAESDPTAFESSAAMDKWANSSWGGALKTELDYKNHKIVVYFRSWTSGVYSSEPFVFVETNGRWNRLLTGAVYSCMMEATIEGDSLIIRRFGATDANKKIEILRFNLKSLDEG